jgi:hypothetical protein
MATLEGTRSLSELYDEALEAMPIDPDGILTFRLPSRLQKKLSSLTHRHRSGKLTGDEQLEMQQFIALEATMRALKSKALAAKSGRGK